MGRERGEKMEDGMAESGGKKKGEKRRKEEKK